MSNRSVPHWLRGLLAAFAIGAAPDADASHGDVEVAACIDKAATAFGIDSLPLEILRDVEGGRPGLSSPNSNGTRDLGVMQINTTWLPQLATMGITEADVRDDACINVYVATYILVQEWKRAGDVALAMARYHSPTPQYQARYLGRIQDAIDRRMPQR